MKIRFPISLKQIILFSLLIILVLGVSTSLVSTMIRTDERIKAEENNLTLNGRTAQTLQSSFENIQNNSFVLFEALSKVSDSTYKNDLIQTFFKSNPDVLFLNSPETELALSIEAKRYEAKLNSFLKNNNSDGVYNASEFFEKPALIFIYEYGPSNAVKKGMVGLDAQSLSDLMSTGSNNATILLDKNANVIINPDYSSKEVKRNDLLPLIEELMTNSAETNTQKIVDGVFTAVHQIQNDLFVVTSVSEKAVYAVINRTTYRIVLFSLAVLFIAIILIRIFSNSITNPIKDLVKASAQIENGDFELDIKPKTSDEIGLLTESFIEMGKGLSEREKLMVSFSKFTNKTIAKKDRRKKQ